MSTENEEWRENSFNEENTGAGRDGNKSYNREGGERPYRPSYNREGGDRRIARDLMPNSEGGERPQRSYGDRSYAIALNVLLTIVKVAIVRIVLASIATMKEANVRNVLTTAKVVTRSYDRPQRPSYNREGGLDRPYRPDFNRRRRW